jgi:hypothetical protein
MSCNSDISIFLAIEANKLNAKTAFSFFEVDVAVNDSEFALAA